jgi:hypothetical protein
MSQEFTMTELDAVEVELLPAREALGVLNFAAVAAQNTSTSLNLLTAFSAAYSQANQAIVVLQ